MSARSSESGERARRYRRYSVAEKLRLVEETAEPGASVSVVARRHDLNANMLFTWRRQVRLGLLTGPAGSSPPMRFVPVEVASALPRPELATVGQPIEIELPNGVRLRLGSEIGDGSLRRLLVVLKAAW